MVSFDEMRSRYEQIGEGLTMKQLVEHWENLKRTDDASQATFHKAAAQVFGEEPDIEASEDADEEVHGEEPGAPAHTVCTNKKDEIWAGVDRRLAEHGFARAVPAGTELSSGDCGPDACRYALQQLTGQQVSVKNIRELMARQIRDETKNDLLNNWAGRTPLAGTSDWCSKRQEELARLWSITKQEGIPCHMTNDAFVTTICAAAGQDLTEK